MSADSPPADGQAPPRRRPPAALVLGVLAGVLAAVTILPTILPLSRRVGQAEDGAAVIRALAASRATSTLYTRDPTLDPFLHHSLGVDGVMVLDAGGTVREVAGDTPAHFTVAEFCPPGEAPGRIVATEDDRWAVACHEIGPLYVVGVVHAASVESRRTGWLVVGLSVMVGISAAFGVLQALSPLSRVSAGLDRIGRGERGVHVTSTGFAELDDLVDRLNEAARASDEREKGFRERLAVVQKIARELAHEVRNPLQSLEFMAGVVAMEDDREERVRIATSIQEEVRKLEAVVRRLLHRDTDASIPVSRMPTVLAKLVEEVVGFRAQHAAQLGTELATGTLARVEAPLDRVLVRMALENLVGNALDAVPTGAGKVRVSVLDEGDVVVLLVEDNGPGVPKEVGETIYLPSVSFKEKGTGLGLALVATVVRAHSGTVKHDRSSLGGAAFRITLPVREPEEDEA